MGDPIDFPEGETRRQCHKCGRIAEPDKMVPDDGDGGPYVCKRWFGCRGKGKK